MPHWPAIAGPTTQWKTRLAALVVLALVGFIPLFGGAGYESALAAGLLLPSLAAGITAWEVVRWKPGPGEALARGVWAGLVLAVLGLLVAVLHGFRVGFCDPVEGLVLYCLGGGFGAVAGGAWGAVCGTLWASTHRARLWSLVAAIGGPVCGVLLSLGRFYTSPMVFAFDPFFGYFAGPLYDTVIDGIPALLTYRFGTLATLTALALVAHRMERSPSGALVFLWRRPVGVMALAGLSAVISLSVSVEGARLGHFSTTPSIRRALGHTVQGARCEVVYSRFIGEREAKLVARECEAHVAEVEEWLGTRGPAQITVFLFASSAEKGSLMGASRTQIAKPWRGEVYVQSAGFPHPVLRHELAHVISGALGSGPFRVAGPLGGWIPDPGRIEGIAEAAAPDEDEDLTLEEWCRALDTLEMLPPLERVFRLSFLSESAVKAYTVAGAFTAWLHRSQGPSAVRRWYSGESLEQVTGKGLSALEQSWLQELRAVPPTPLVLQAARARFERPAIFDRRCPRSVDRWSRYAGTELAAGRWSEARVAFQEILRLDTGDYSAKLGVASCEAHQGSGAGARATLEALASDPKLVSLQRLIAEERLADLDLRDGRIEEARRAYAKLEGQHLDDDRVRTLELKRWVAPDPHQRGAVVALLIGERDSGPDLGIAAARLGEWSARDPGDGVPEYLLGRNFLMQGRYEEAARRLDRALRRALPLDRIRREALRMRLVAACALDDVPAARLTWRHWTVEGEPQVRSALAQGVRALARRCGVTEAAHLQRRTH